MNVESNKESKRTTAGHQKDAHMNGINELECQQKWQKISVYSDILLYMENQSSVCNSIFALIDKNISTENATSKQIWMYHGSGTGACCCRCTGRCCVCTHQMAVLSAWNNVMTAILKVRHHIRNMTRSIDEYLFIKYNPAKLNPNLIWNDKSLRLFYDGRPTRTTRITTRKVVIWDQFLIQILHTVLWVKKVNYQTTDKIWQKNLKSQGINKPDCCCILMM